MEEWDRENKALREREYSVFLDRRKKKKEQLRRDRFNSTIAREKEVWAKNDARLKAMPAAAKVRFVRRAVNRPNASGGSPRTAPLREDASSSDEDASSSDEDDDDMDPEDAFGYESEELVSAEVIFGEEDARDAYELARGAATRADGYGGHPGILHDRRRDGRSLYEGLLRRPALHARAPVQQQRARMLPQEARSAPGSGGPLLSDREEAREVGAHAAVLHVHQRRAS
ncbi:hypothetical protein AURANDRAFT_67633 [Aureococcus anophagefferens]|uniref:Uncharacterized protein n=1 Tax=Aureococcus anophagefferens TaxID=44056 RepID=F0YLQ4_AURAN|nr:hypothetical protein AURANDRAFT_67633 [Aureococcus anophagefferens]EGB03937.1 hypothetical protein AURANDRAFT_67633 [Aureococcus anophagefferens]|eukprot:XP_009041361.1 hypothetical protein AURANDRAFT_67633 [Aureococcus anophagefferens]